MKKQPLPDDGKTTDTTVIAYHLSVAAAESGKPMSDEEAHGLAFTEARKRRDAAVTSRVEAFNNDASAQAMLTAARQVGGFSERVAEADARVAYQNAGYTTAEAVLLAKEKLNALRNERLAEMRRVASLIENAKQGTTVEASATSSAPAGKGTFKPIAKPAKTPAPIPELQIPPGMTPSEAMTAAMRGHLQAKPAKAHVSPVTVMANAMLADARAAGDKDFTLTEATSIAFTRIHGKQATK